MGYVSKYPGSDRKSRGEADNGTQLLTQPRPGCQAIRRRKSGTSPVHRDNHNVIQRKGKKK
jgi:hypothetical protein